jgi:flagellar biosynthesis protein FlhB
MADSASDRTEAPTAERLRKARREGQVPQSDELPSALMMGALLVVSCLAASELWGWFTTEVTEGLTFRWTGSLNIDSFINLFRDKISAAMWALAPFLGATMAASILGSILVSGASVAPAGIKWNFSALAPSAGLKTLFSLKSAVHMGMSLVKLAVLGTIAWMYLGDKLGLVLALDGVTPMAALAVTFELVFGLVARITIALMVIAVGDVVYQKWQYKRQLRMTREEVREERRSLEGSPMVRGRMRAIHIAMVRKRMLRDVPKANVIVVNPTHVAVALKYDAETMDAPVVLAKGAEKLCEKIKEIARKHNVPIVERPEIARSLYATVEVGQTIPESLYVAVAEILAMILRMRRRGA